MMIFATETYMLQLDKTINNLTFNLKCYFLTNVHLKVHVHLKVIDQYLELSLLVTN